MRALLDTCAVSEFVNPPGKVKASERISAMVRDRVFVSVVTFGEIAKGVALLDAGPRKDELIDFLRDLEHEYRGRVLDVDVETARIWGGLTAIARKRGRTVAAIDGLIAATAIQHGLTVVTRNVSDFEATGAEVFNPWLEE